MKKSSSAASLRRKQSMLLGAAALWLTASVGVVAQDRQPPAGDPPAPAMRSGKLTPAQKLVASLPPPMPPGGRPSTPPSDEEAPSPPAEAPAPPPSDASKPSSDPRDLSGGWVRDTSLPSLARIQNDVFGEPLPYTMAGAKILQRRVLAMAAGTPLSNASAICRPPGVQWQHDIAFPFAIFQTKNYVEFIFFEYHGRWYIQLDPAFAPPPAEKQYMGYSVGRWDGDTLVVETTGQKEDVWIDFEGTPLSRDAKIVTRIRKVDYGDGQTYLEMAITINDAAYYTQPWSMIRKFKWNSPALGEYNCEEQIGDPSMDAYGLNPETE